MKIFGRILIFISFAVLAVGGWQVYKMGFASSADYLLFGAVLALFGEVISKISEEVDEGVDDGRNKEEEQSVS